MTVTLRQVERPIERLEARMYTDASCDFTSKISSIGISDETGLISLSKRVEYNNNVTVIEALAVLETLVFLENTPYNCLYIHTDSQNLYNLLDRPNKKAPEEIKKVIRQIRKKAKDYQEVHISLISRSINGSAHKLAEKARNVN